MSGLYSWGRSNFLGRSQRANRMRRMSELLETRCLLAVSFPDVISDASLRTLTFESEPGTDVVATPVGDFNCDGQYDFMIARRNAAASNHPQRLGRPVVAPYSEPLLRNNSPVELSCSVGNGPEPTLVA